MPTPVLEQCAANLATRLASITAANGYETTIVAVDRPTRAGTYQARHLLLVLEQGEVRPAPDTEDQIEGNQALRELECEFSAICFLKPSDTSTDPVDTALNACAADVHAAVMKDRADVHSGFDPPTLGGVALPTTDVGLPVGFEYVDGSFSGVVVPVLVRWRTDWDDPYVNRSS